MKKQTTLLLLLLITTFASAQKSEKIKGSKTVSITTKEIGNFTSLEIGDNIEVHMEFGEKCGVKIEADDNLHDVIAFDLNTDVLRISTTRTITSYKKLSIQLTYTNSLKTITVRDKAEFNAIQEIQLDDIAFKSFDDAKLFLNVKSKNFTLESDNDSKTELNLKSDNAIIQLSKSAELKALITSDDFKCDLYQKSQASIEGDVKNGVLRLDNNSELTAKKLTIKNAQVVAESNSECSIDVRSNLTLEASGDSKIDLYGSQKIDLKKFTDNAVLSKK